MVMQPTSIEQEITPEPGVIFYDALNALDDWTLKLIANYPESVVQASAVKGQGEAQPYLGDKFKGYSDGEVIELYAATVRNNIIEGKEIDHDVRNEMGWRHRQREEVALPADSGAAIKKLSVNVRDYSDKPGQTTELTSMGRFIERLTVICGDETREIGGHTYKAIKLTNRVGRDVTYLARIEVNRTVFFGDLTVIDSLPRRSSVQSELGNSLKTPEFDALSAYRQYYSMLDIMPATKKPNYSRVANLVSITEPIPAKEADPDDFIALVADVVHGKPAEQIEEAAVFRPHHNIVLDATNEREALVWEHTITKADGGRLVRQITTGIDNTLSGWTALFTANGRVSQVSELDRQSIAYAWYEMQHFLNTPDHYEEMDRIRQVKEQLALNMGNLIMKRLPTADTPAYKKALDMSEDRARGVGFMTATVLDRPTTPSD